MKILPALIHLYTILLTNEHLVESIYQHQQHITIEARFPSLLGEWHTKHNLSYDKKGLNAGVTEVNRVDSNRDIISSTERRWKDIILA